MNLISQLVSMCQSSEYIVFTECVHIENWINLLNFIVKGHSWRTATKCVTCSSFILHRMKYITFLLIYVYVCSSQYKKKEAKRNWKRLIEQVRAHSQGLKAALF